MSFSKPQFTFKFLLFMIKELTAAAAVDVLRNSLINVNLLIAFLKDSMDSKIV